MPGEIAASVGSKINFSGAWEACGRWAQRSFEFCKEVSTKIGPENLRIGGTVVIGNSLFYLLTSALIGCGERRFATHELTSGSTTESQRNIKKHLLHEIFPFTLTVLFNYAISHLFKLQLSTTAIFGISVGALALRMLLNRQFTPTTPTLPTDPVLPLAGPDAERSTDHCGNC